MASVETKSEKKYSINYTDNSKTNVDNSVNKKNNGSRSLVANNTSNGLKHSHGQSPLNNSLAGSSNRDYGRSINKGSSNRGFGRSINNDSSNSSSNGSLVNNGSNGSLVNNGSGFNNSQLNNPSPVNNVDSSNINGSESSSDSSFNQKNMGFPGMPIGMPGRPGVGIPGNGSSGGQVPDGLKNRAKNAAKVAGSTAAKTALAGATGGATEIPVVKQVVGKAVDKVVDDAVEKAEKIAKNIPGSPLANKGDEKENNGGEGTIEKMTGLNPKQQKIVLVCGLCFCVFLFGFFIILIDYIAENKLGAMDVGNDILNDDAAKILNDAYLVPDEIIDVKLVSHQYGLSDIKDMFNNSENSSEYARKFYLKLYDLYYLYLSKYKVNLDISVIISTLIYNSEDIEETFHLNLSDYDRQKIVEADWKPDDTTELDWDYDYESKYNYLVSNDFSMDMQVLAKNMVRKTTTQKCVDSEDNVVTSKEVKDNEDDLTCGEGETLKKESSSYKIDLDKFNEFLPEYIEKKYYLNRSVLFPVRSNGPDYVSDKKPSVTKKKNKKKSSSDSANANATIQKLNKIALDQVGNGPGAYGFSGNWCANFVSWLFKQVDDENKYIVSSAVAGDIPRESINAGLDGEWLEDECYDSSTVPKAGDIVLFDPYIDGVTIPWPDNGNDKYYSSHIGYVYNVDDEYIYTIEGNSTGGLVSNNTHSRKKCGSKSHQGINGYYRPNYGDISSSSSSSSDNKGVTLVKSNGSFKKDILYYNQYDYKDSSYSVYGTIASHGCGPTSLAIAISSILSEEHDPIEMTNYLCSKENACYDSGSNYMAVFRSAQDYGSNYGFDVEITSDIDLVRERLSSGNSLVITCTNGGLRTSAGNVISTGGHYFVLTGMADSDQAYMSDPANPYNSNPDRTIGLSAISFNTNNSPDNPSFCILTMR